jgi:putative acetyltransferase
MATAHYVVRQAVEADFDGWFAVYEAVAAEGKWIGREVVDREESRRWYSEAIAAPTALTAGTVGFVALAGDRIIGHLALHTHAGLGDVAMAIVADWRGRGVGSALMAAAIDRARHDGLHKLALQLWPHNTAAFRLYQKVGFIEEGRLRRHYRRRNGELWDALVMGLVLDTTTPGSPYDASAAP